MISSVGTARVEFSNFWKPTKTVFWTINESKCNSPKHSFGYSESETLSSPKRTLHTVALYSMLESIIIIASLIVVYIVYAIYSNKNFEQSLKKLASKRPIITKEDFIKKMKTEGFEDNHIETVYDELNDYLKVDGFYIYPDDNIHEVYKINDLDDVELVDSICKKLGIPTPEQSDYDELGKQHSLLTPRTILILLKKLNETEYNIT
ncbi:MAG: hypothetical protein OCD76_17435 [Reichenbachiella sp.]